VWVCFLDSVSFLEQERTLADKTDDQVRFILDSDAKKEQQQQQMQQQMQQQQQLAHEFKDL